MLDSSLSDELRVQLDAMQLRPIVEYLARRLDLDDGHRNVQFELENGNLRRTRFGHERVGNTELEYLAR